MFVTVADASPLLRPTETWLAVWKLGVIDDARAINGEYAINGADNYVKRMFETTTPVTLRNEASKTLGRVGKSGHQRTRLRSWVLTAKFDGRGLHDSDLRMAALAS